MSWPVRFSAARSSVGTCADCFTAAHVASVVHQPPVRVPISLTASEAIAIRQALPGTLLLPDSAALRAWDRSW
ncbi:hypothetical protein [Xylella fastidiosa]|uniref:hypothetical protein n=1 Tax=Xylella fastidiosa TaxID=2371 RepID=UPI001B36682D|nr:hypothetical protein [Xylella fastidiosa]MDD0942617.1 hypothetical protein [Xylella fastidiosa subsp. multiplex]QTX29948.1 hypothetical protein KBP48_11050 [Xylella fastidiosa subsp. multiplex]